MNSEVKEKWVAALRSGEYSQAKYALRRETSGGSVSFCCLGVLCELHDRELNQAKSYSDSAGGLPEHIMDWAEIKGPFPTVKREGKINTLTFLNDIQGLSFNQIANIIEDHL